MKIIKTIVTVLAFLSMLPLVASANDMQAYEKMVEDLDAVQAMAIANQWKWTQSNIKTYVNSKEVDFEFPGNKIKRIPLPKDKMVIAVAPYINYTHG